MAASPSNVRAATVVDMQALVTDCVDDLLQKAPWKDMPSTHTLWPVSRALRLAQTCDLLQFVTVAELADFNPTQVEKVASTTITMADELTSVPPSAVHAALRKVYTHLYGASQHPCFIPRRSPRRSPRVEGSGGSAGAQRSSPSAHGSGLHIEGGGDRQRGRDPLRVQHPASMLRRPDVSAIQGLPEKVMPTLDGLRYTAQLLPSSPQWVSVVDQLFMWLLHVQGSLQFPTALVDRAWELLSSDMENRLSNSAVKLFLKQYSKAKFAKALCERRHPGKEARGCRLNRLGGFPRTPYTGPLIDHRILVHDNALADVDLEGSSLRQGEPGFKQVGDSVPAPATALVPPPATALQPTSTDPAPAAALGLTAQPPPPRGSVPAPATALQPTSTDPAPAAALGLTAQPPPPRGSLPIAMAIPLPTNGPSAMLAQQLLQVAPQSMGHSSVPGLQAGLARSSNESLNAMMLAVQGTGQAAAAASPPVGGGLAGPSAGAAAAGAAAGAAAAGAGAAAVGAAAAGAGAAGAGAAGAAAAAGAEDEGSNGKGGNGKGGKGGRRGGRGEGTEGSSSSKKKQRVGDGEADAAGPAEGGGKSGEDKSAGKTAVPDPKLTASQRGVVSNVLHTRLFAVFREIPVEELPGIDSACELLTPHWVASPFLAAGGKVAYYVGKPIYHHKGVLYCWYPPTKSSQTTSPGTIEAAGLFASPQAVADARGPHVLFELQEWCSSTMAIPEDIAKIQTELFKTGVAGVADQKATRDWLWKALKLVLGTNHKIDLTGHRISKCMLGLPLTDPETLHTMDIQGATQ